MPVTRHVADMVAEAQAIIPRVSPEDAAAMQASGEAVVDIRDVRELAKTGKIADAVHAPRGMIEFWADPQSPYHKEIFATDQKLICAPQAGARRWQQDPDRDGHG